jgi:hypothetical protein
MEVYLRSGLWAVLILFVIALIFAAVQMILILFDVRQISKESKKIIKRVKALTGVFDAVTMVTGGIEEVKKRVVKEAISKTNWKAFIAGLKKGVQVLFGGEK